MPPSSTSAFKHPPTLRQVLVTLTLSFVVLVVADRLFGVVIDHTTTPNPSIFLYNGRGVARLWDLTGSGITPIAFLGSSQMQAAVSPDLFDRDVAVQTGMQIKSVNLSSIGSTTFTTQNILANLIVPYNINTIFIGLEMRSLRRGTNQDYWLFLYQNSPLGSILLNSFLPERSISLWLMEHSTIVRYRENLRNWLSSQAQPDDSFITVDEDGHWILKGVFDRSGKTIDEQFVPFHPDPQFEEALTDIAKVCQQEKLKCIFVNMLLHPNAYQYITAQDNQAYWNIVLETAKAYGMPLWNFDTAACHTLFRDSYFYDLNHLNEDGAKLFTDQLANLYIQQRIDPSKALGDNCATIVQ